MTTQTKKEEEILCGGCGKNDMRNYYKFPFPEDRCSDCEEEDSDEEKEEPYCFKDTTIDTVEKDICFCSVGGCVKPSFWKPKKYRYSEEEEEEVGNCGSCDKELDHLRDGTTEDGHRCSDCYWTETVGYIPNK